MQEMFMYLCENWQTDSHTYLEMQRSRIAKLILKKQNRPQGHTLSEIMPLHKVTINPVCYSWMERIENPVADLQKHAHMILWQS